MSLLPRWFIVLAALLFTGVTLWLRWPGFGFSLWNVDEAIHAGAARIILQGGVLYRDVPDIRHPLSYYAMAAVFAAFGENNLWAARCLVTLLIAGTSLLLFLVGRCMRNTAAGMAAGGLYALLSSAILYPGDAYAINTEWFVAFFSAGAAATFLAGGPTPCPRRLCLTGVLMGCAFLSKQPALLEMAAPVGALAYVAWRRGLPGRTLIFQLLAGAAGWLAPVLATVAYFGAKGALAEALFCTWTYPLTYYGPEVSGADRLAALFVPFRLFGVTQPALVGLWLAGALVVLHRLVQRTPRPVEEFGNPHLVYLAVWSLAALGGAASSGRNIDHDFIPFLVPFCVGCGLAMTELGAIAWCPARTRMRRHIAAVLIALLAYQAVSIALTTRGRTVSEDPSRCVADCIHNHSGPDDRIFVWGFHPDIYLYADRRSASRYLFGSFLTGLIPWTNTDSATDTTYAVVPGAMELLLADLAKRQPLFIVDCRVGPNRYWQKYPTEKYPGLHRFIQANYLLVEAHQFGPQGFHLYRRRLPGEPAGNAPDPAPLAGAVAALLKFGTIAAPLTPVRASAPYGASLIKADGRLEYYLNAPSFLVYRLPATTVALRGGYGIKPGAYAATNPSPTDGAEFIIRWCPVGGGERKLLRRILRPAVEPADTGSQSFRLVLPPHAGGELELSIRPGPADNVASDWTYWTGLALENSR